MATAAKLLLGQSIRERLDQPQKEAVSHTSTEGTDPHGHLVSPPKPYTFIYFLTWMVYYHVIIS